MIYGYFLIWFICHVVGMGLYPTSEFYTSRAQWYSDTDKYNVDFIIIELQIFYLNCFNWNKTKIADRYTVLHSEIVQLFHSGRTRISITHSKLKESCWMDVEYPQQILGNFLPSWLNDNNINEGSPRQLRWGRTRHQSLDTADTPSLGTYWFMLPTLLQSCASMLCLSCGSFLL